jgi:hypothetical protein
MNDAPNGDLCRYQIEIREKLDPRWTAWFDGMELAIGPNHTTLLTGTLRDQAALYGLLAKARDLGLTLLSVTRLESHSDEHNF